MPDDLAKLKEHYLRCVRCGQCRSACPVFGEIKTESSSPRAKVYLAYLLASGGTSAYREAQHLLANCLLCRACTAECPSAIPVHQVITAARAKAAIDWTSSLKNFVAKSLFTHPSLLALALAAVSICRPAASTPGVPEFLSPLASLPPAKTRRTAKTLLPASVSPVGRTKLRVGYFLGCATNFYFPEIALDTVNVLSSLGCEVIIPGNTACCGAPLTAMGLSQAAARLQFSNLQAFSRAGADVVVTDCPTCALSLIEAAGEGPEKKIKVYEAIQLVANLLPGGKSVFQKIKEPVTCHYPCHLTHALKGGDTTSRALQFTCADYREMPGAAGCCGGGGTFFLSHRHISSSILKKKVENIGKTGASVVAASCPLCQIQLSRGLKEAGYKISVVHPIQILAASLRLKTSPAR